MTQVHSRVFVIGAGAFGVWAAWWLKRLGVDVLLVDARGPGNPHSSSGGDTRVVRSVYGSDRLYTEMVCRSLVHWRELSTTTGDKLFFETGALWTSGDTLPYVETALPILRDFGLELERLEPREVAARFPQFDERTIRLAYFEPQAGVVRAAEACRSLVESFVSNGGRYRRANVELALASHEHVEVRVEGETVAADMYVFACGPWLRSLFPEVLENRMHVTRQEEYYFAVPRGTEGFGPDRMPVSFDFGERVIVCLPDVDGQGFKIVDDSRGEPYDPSSGDRTPTPGEVQRLREYLAERFPALSDAPFLEGRVCQYANSPDGDLIVDRHPHHRNCWLVGGGSGHGFKLSPAVGESVARAIVEGHEPPEKFGLGRLVRQDSSPSQFDHLN